MRRTDGQVSSVLRAVTETLLRTPWRIDPAGARSEVVEFVADDLGLPILGQNPKTLPRLKDRFSWVDHLREALLMLVFGHSYFEQLYRVTEDGSRAHLRKLELRPSRTIENIDVASDGGLVSIKQLWTATHTDPKPIPVNRLVAYIHAKEGGNWIGTSILRPVYKNWLLKDRLLRTQTQTIERNGMGVPLYKAQEGASEADLAAGKGMATAWRAGEAAGSAVPFGADLILRGVDGTLPDAQPAIEYHDSQIARAVLAHFLNLGTQTGSWALGSTFADFFTMSLQTLAEQVRDTATSHVIEDLVDINFGESEPAPRLAFDEIGSRQAATAEAMKTLVDAGILRPDQVLEGAARQYYGLPPADTETIRNPPPTSTATTPEPPQMGDSSVAASAVAAKFNPDEPRRPDGKWGTGGIVHDALKLADRIQLGKDERLVGSDKVGDGRGDYSTVMARVDGPDGPRLRLGVVDTSEGPKKWRASNGGATVVLDQRGAGELRRVVAEAQVKGPKSVADYRADIKARHARGEPDSQWPSPEADIAQGVIHGSDWGDIEWTLTREEGPDYIVGGVNLGPGGKWLLSLDVKATDNQLGPLDSFDIYSSGVAQKLDGALAGLMGTQVAAAAGIDTHPGGEQLKHWWVYGEGRAKWDTWTELYHHLVKYLNPEMAKRTAAEWYHLRFGIWPGADLNRVKHGKPPRGHRVGPG
jgi:hypothetical protein